MSALEILGRINRRLDDGWKMSNQSCPVCKTIILGHPETKEFYCVKCEMPAKIVADDEEYEIEVIGSSNYNKEAVEEIDYEEYNKELDNMVFSKKREEERKKSDALSKKMGDLLLQGWAMLEDTCPQCLFPIMRSKKGELVCVGCGPVEKKQAQPKTPQKPVVKAEEKKVEEPVQKPIAEPQKSTQSANKESQIQEIQSQKHTQPEAPKETVKEKQNESKPEVPVKKESSCQQIHNADLFRAAKFDDSIDFYSTITEVLKKEVISLSQKGLSSNLAALSKLIEVQQTVDNAKKTIFLNHNQ
jgi:uncharacterized Zn finger protein (UPF0148 family)